MTWHAHFGPRIAAWVRPPPYAVAACLALCAALGAAGCGPSFEAHAAHGFVEVERQESAYDFRAIAPEGVAFAVREVDVETEQRVAFWENAVALRMRELEGYALLETKDVATANGTKGRELLFGHDESGKPFLYRMRLFVVGDRLFVIEAGGRKDLMDRYQKSVGWMFEQVRVD